MPRIIRRPMLILTIALIVVPLLWSSIFAAPTEGIYTNWERFGVGYTGGFGHPLDAYDLEQLRVFDKFSFGWYSDWGLSADPLRPEGMEYVQLIAVGPSFYQLPLPPTSYWNRLATLVDAVPGSLWLIGNEPERKEIQGDRSPDEYARIYHDLYDFIKRRDNTAQVYVGGVVQASRLRMKWLDAVLAKYVEVYEEPMPMDGWSIHEQILPEIDGSWGSEVPKGIDDSEGIGLDLAYADNASVELFIQQVTEFRQWMKLHGYQNKPLIISEYGVLLPSSLLGEAAPYPESPIALGDQMVKDFMLDTFDWLLDAADVEIGYAADGYRLVQRWLWYSLNDKPYDGEGGFNGSLFVFDQPNLLTQFGLSFQKYAWDLWDRSARKLYLPLGIRNAN